MRGSGLACFSLIQVYPIEPRIPTHVKEKWYSPRALLVLLVFTAGFLGLIFSDVDISNVSGSELIVIALAVSIVGVICFSYGAYAKSAKEESRVRCSPCK